MPDKPYEQHRRDKTWPETRFVDVPNVEVIYGDGHYPLVEVYMKAHEAEEEFPGIIRELAPATAKHIARIDHALWLAINDPLVPSGDWFTEYSKP